MNALALTGFWLYKPQPMIPGAVMKFGSVTYIGVNSIKDALEWPKEKGTSESGRI